MYTVPCHGLSPRIAYEKYVVSLGYLFCLQRSGRSEGSRDLLSFMHRVGEEKCVNGRSVVGASMSSSRGSVSIRRSVFVCEKISMRSSGSIFMGRSVCERGAHLSQKKLDLQRY